MPQAEGVHFQRAPGPVVWFSAFAAAGGIKNCGGAATTTLGAEGPVKPKNPPAAGRSNLRTLSAEGAVTYIRRDVPYAISRRRR